jgi:hypothetical protein
MRRLIALLLLLLAAPAAADMFPDASNAKLPEARDNILYVHAKCDGQEVTDGAVSAGSTALSSETANFKAADVGKTIGVEGAGIDASRPHVTTIAAFVSATSVTLATPATTASSAATVYWVTNDKAVFQAAITAAAFRTLYAPPGRCYAPGLTLSNINFVGGGGQDIQAPYGRTGTVFITLDPALTAPQFTVSNGGALRHVRFYDPMQRGRGIDVSQYPTITGTPIPYPWKVKAFPGKAQILDDLIAYNAWNYIEVGDATGASRNSGALTCTGIRGMALNEYLHVVNNAGFAGCTGVNASAIWFAQVANAGTASEPTAQALGKWQQRHAVFARWTNGGAPTVSGEIVYGYSKGIVVDGIAGLAPNNVTTNGIVDLQFDSTPVVFSLTDGLGSVNNLRFAPRAYFGLDRYVTAIRACRGGSPPATCLAGSYPDPSYDPGPVFNITGGGNCTSVTADENGVIGRCTMSIAGTLEAAMSGGVAVAGDNVTTFAPSVVDLDGLKIKGWAAIQGMGDATAPAVLMAATEANLRCRGCYIDGTNATPSGHQSGIKQTAGTVSIGSTAFLDVWKPVEILGGSALCNGSYSAGTTGPLSTSVAAGLPYRETACTWDKPSTTSVYDVRASLLYTNTANLLQVFDDTETVVYFDSKKFDRGGNYSNVVQTGTINNANKQIAGLTTAALGVGMVASGAGIPNVAAHAPCVIVTIDSASQVTVSCQPAANATQSITFTSGAFVAPVSGDYECQLTAQVTALTTGDIWAVKFTPSVSTTNSLSLWRAPSGSTQSMPVPRWYGFLAAGETLVPSIVRTSGTGTLTIANNAAGTRFNCHYMTQ